MSTLYTHRGSGPQDLHPGAKMTYDGEGRELGMMTLAEAAELGEAEYEEETDTITVL